MALAFCSFARYILGRKEALGRKERKLVGWHHKFKGGHLVDTTESSSFIK